MTKTTPRGRFLLYGLSLAALLSSLMLLADRWPAPWTELFQHPDRLPLELAAVQMALLPEMATAFLVGGLLTLATLCLQHLVCNDLASDSTLAIGSGAQLLLMFATLGLPALGLLGGFSVALMGSGLSLGLVLLLAWPRLEPLQLIIGGMVVNLLFGAVAALLVQFYPEQLMGIMLWGAGSLRQDGFGTVQILLGASLLAALVLALVYRPLVLLSLDEASARRLGVPVTALRNGLLALSALLVALLTASVGVFGFMGLLGAALANRFGLHGLGARLGLGYLGGGSFLLLLSNLLNYCQWNLPAGALTAVLGAPLLLYLLSRQRPSGRPTEEEDHRPRRRLQSWKPLGWGLLALVLLTVLSLHWAPTASGWRWSNDWPLISEYRLPRTLSALAVGALLATGGLLLQILSRNPLASPEVLGVSSGAGLAVVIALLLWPSLGAGALLAVGSGGALAVLLVLLVFARRLPPPLLLLTGVAINALLAGLLQLLSLSGNPRLTAVLGWLGGSTYRATLAGLPGLLLATLLLLALAAAAVKALKLLQLGPEVARALGLNLRRSQGLLFLLVALLAAVATLAVGPLSFIGLMAPQLARRLGGISLEKQWPLTLLIGAGLLLLADYGGRYLIFPYEIGAGTLAALFGGAYFLFLVKGTSP